MEATSAEKSTGALSGTDVSRAIASAMADSHVRATVRDAMASSPYARHRILLQRFLGSDAGKPLLSGMAEDLGTTPVRLIAALGDVPSLEFYLPKRADRVVWSGSDRLAVAAAVEVGEVPELAFSPDGTARAVVDLQSRSDAMATFILRPARSQMLREQPSLQISPITVQDPAELDRASSSVTYPLDATAPATVAFEACETGTEISCDGGGGGTPLPPSTYLGRLYVVNSADNGSMTDPVELRFKSYWRPSSGGQQVTELGYDAPNAFIGLVDRVLTPNVYSGSGSLRIEVWENDGWFVDDHYGSVEFPSTGARYSPYGSFGPTEFVGGSRCNGFTAVGYFQCPGALPPPVGVLPVLGTSFPWKEVSFNLWHK
jgi:hypothetical protein